MSQAISQEDWNYWYNQVYGFFYRRVGDKFWVEELTSATLNAFFLRIESPDNPEKFIWGIARHKLFDYFKSKKNKPQNLELQEFDGKNDQDLFLSLAYKEKLKNLEECIKNQLKAENLKIVELCILEDFSSQKVAEQMSLTSANVRQKLSRSLKKLREKCREIWS